MRHPLTGVSHGTSTTRAALTVDQDVADLEAEVRAIADRLSVAGRQARAVANTAAVAVKARELARRGP